MVNVAYTLIAIAATAVTLLAAAGPEVRVATVNGRVLMTGSVPAGQPIDMSSEPFCRAAQRGTPVKQPVRVGAANGLAGVIVHIKGVPANASKLLPTEPIMLDQQACQYNPQVLALRVGQPLLVRNSDGVLHNVHATPKLNQPFNLGQPMAGMQSRRTFRAAELGIPVRCDIHDWMQATIGVFDHSFFAVTDADGRFTIDALPPGEYELEAWHPELGSRVQRIRVSDGAAAPVTITYSAT